MSADANRSDRSPQLPYQGQESWVVMRQKLASFVRSILLVAALLGVLQGTVLALVGPVQQQLLREAINLYGRVERFWEAKIRGDREVMASMLVPSARELFLSQAKTRIGGTRPSPMVAGFVIESITLSRDARYGSVQVSFKMSLPGAPVSIPNRQTELWEKIGSEWFQRRMWLATEQADRAVTEVISPEEFSALDPRQSEKFDRYRIAYFLASKGCDLYRQGKLEEASETLRRATKIGGARIWRRLIRVEQLVGTEVWDRILPRQTNELLELVSVLERVGRAKTAVTILEQRLASNPDDPKLLERLGDIFSGLGRDEDAIRCYSKAAPLGAWSSDFQRLKLKLGRKYLASERCTDAVVALAHSAAADPKGDLIGPALELLGRALLEEGQVQRAFRVFSIASQVSTASPGALVGRAQAALLLGDSDDALSCAWLLDGSVAEQRDVLIKVWRAVRKRAAQPGSKASDYYTLGLLAEALGKVNSAKKAFQAALRLEPNHIGSTVHLLGLTGLAKGGTSETNSAGQVAKMFHIGQAAGAVSLAKALSRSPAAGAAGLRTGALNMPVLFGEGQWARVVLAVGKDSIGAPPDQSGIMCADGATLAIDVAISGRFLLSFDILPFALQARFEPVLLLKLDSEPLELLLLQLYRQRVGKVIELEAGVHSLQFVFDPIAGRPRRPSSRRPRDRFLLSNLTLVPVGLASSATIGRTGVAAPVEIVARSRGAFSQPIDEIYVDGTQVAPLSPGYNVVVVERSSGMIAKSVNFAPAGDRFAEAKFKQLVDYIKPSTIVAVAVCGDGAYRATPTTDYCIAKLGGRSSPFSEKSWADMVCGVAGVELPSRKNLKGRRFPSRFRSSYALIGAKDAAYGTALQMSRFGQSTLAVVSDRKVTLSFLDALKPCAKKLWAESARRLTKFFSTGHYNFIRRLPLSNPGFLRLVLPRIKSDDSTFFLLLGYRLAECSLWRSALKAFNKSVSLQQSAEAHFAKAMVLGKRGEYKKARQAYLDGSAISPRPQLKHLRLILQGTDQCAVEAVYAAAFDASSFHFVNGVKTVSAWDGWAMTAVDAKSGKIIAARKFGWRPTAVAEALASVPEGAIIILTASAVKPTKLNLVLANAIQHCLERGLLPQDVFRNLVIIGYKSRKPTAFIEASFEAASLMAVWD